MAWVDYTAPANPSLLMSVLPSESGVAQGTDWRWTRQRWMRWPWQESALSPPIEAGVPIEPEGGDQLVLTPAGDAPTGADLAAIADELDASRGIGGGVALAVVAGLGAWLLWRKT